MIHRLCRRNRFTGGPVLSNSLSDFSDIGSFYAAERPPRRPNRGGNSSESEHSGSGDGDVALEEDVRDELQQPPKYAVVLLNDDYTTMEFVVEVLQRFFKKTGEEALQIMLRVHQEGRGVAGVYSHDIAETKVFQVHQLAKSRGYPLHCVIEPLK
jgi:ATP-dependent Clp protease adaptor protein ClpS